MILWDWRYRQLKVTLLVLGTELESDEKAGRAHNCLAISPGLLYFDFKSLF